MYSNPFEKSFYLFRPSWWSWFVNCFLLVLFDAIRAPYHLYLTQISVSYWHTCFSTCHSQRRFQFFFFSAFLCVLSSYYSTQYGLQYPTTLWVSWGALRIKAGIQFTRWTRILLISYWPGDHAVFHINPCRTVPLGVLQRIQCQQTRPCALSHGIYHNWNSYPILYQLFHLCQFCPWVNFALHRFPSSWAICNNLCLITPSLIDESLWPPAPSVFQWNRTGGTVRCEGTSRNIKLWPLVSESSEINSLLMVCEVCLTWSTGMTRRGFKRLINGKCNLTNAWSGPILC